MERLYDIVTGGGDVQALRELLGQEPFLLERVSYKSPNNTPLHVATMKDNLPFIKEILTKYPHLAEELNSQQSSPLHVASARGHVEIARCLFDSAPDMCLSRDSQGRNPIHLAAIKGHVGVLKELVPRAPLAAQETAERGFTVLHLCVKYGQLEALKFLVIEMKEMIDEKNDDGDTILHMALKGKKHEVNFVKSFGLIMNFLFDFAPDMCLSRDSQGWNPIHLAAIKGHVGVLKELVPRAPLAAQETVERGLTVLHLCVKYGQLEALKFLVIEMKELIDEKNDDGDTILHMALKGKKHEIKKHLLQDTNINVNAKNSKGQTAKAIFNQSQPNSRFQTFCKSKKTRQHCADPQPEKWLSKKRDAIMVVAVLIATMAFQAGMTPAGGVWQEDFTHHPNGTLVDNSLRHKAGEAVMAHKHPQFYKNFTRSNTVAFVSSLSTIMLLISGLPFRRPLFMWVLMVIMWLTVTAVAVSFAISIDAVTPSNYKEVKSLFHVLEISLYVWCGVMGLLFFGNTARLIGRGLKNCGSLCCTPKWHRDPVEVSHDRNGGHHHEESV